jgi:hypothetical protein
MEKGDEDTNQTEQPPPSLREEMSRLLESMDPQGLLNMGDREETTHPEGVDHTKSGDAHAAEHDISFTDNGSDAGSGSRQDGSKPDGSVTTTQEKTGSVRKRRKWRSALQISGL